LRTVKPTPPLVWLTIVLVLLMGSGFSSHLWAKSIKHIKTISFIKGKKAKSVTSWLLGRKKQESVNPVSICMVGSDKYCITDAVQGAVIILRDNGKVIKRITHVKGVKLVAPVSACVDDIGNLYVSDSGLQGVLKFNSRFKYKNIFFGQTGIRITGITFWEGIFYALDTPSHRVLCIDRQGKIKDTYGRRGTGEGEFNFPTHITVDQDYLYITDAMNFRVQILDHSGGFVMNLGGMGRGGGNFSKPKGIAVDKEKRIFVADAMFDNIQVFNIKGQFLHYFGGPGQGSGEFWMPTGIMTAPNNIIWVTDTYNHRLQLFQVQED
jgi:6-bladed beta-propeller